MLKKYSFYILTASLLISLLTFPCQADYKKGGFYSMARMGYFKEVKEHLKKTRNREQKRLDGALMAAVSGDRPKMVRFLIKEGANPNLNVPGPTPLIIAAIMNNYFQAADSLLREDINVNVKGFRHFHKGLFINWEWTAVMAAAYKGKLEILKLLHKKGANLFTSGWSRFPIRLETAADIAAYSGHVEVLRYLLKNNVQLHPDTVYDVVRSGHLNVLEYLVNLNKIDLNRQGPNEGKTLLMEACWWGRVDIVQFLLDKDVNINQRNKMGGTALMEALKNKFKEFPRQYDIARLLLEHGANPNIGNYAGITPLMLAQDPEMIAELKSHGAKK
ncbi:MAG: ankyrin repeat domain-containing protein [Candidatus Omnitrophica bacterium]|nr:ankyrin repeat domain-containing protein [Candidatus Omnitrophota bacterium]